MGGGAIGQYEEAAARFHNKPRFYVLIGRLLEDDDNDLGALAYYREGLSAEPGQAGGRGGAAVRGAEGGAGGRRGRVSYRGGGVAAARVVSSSRAATANANCVNS